MRLIILAAIVILVSGVIFAPRIFRSGQSPQAENGQLQAGLPAGQAGIGGGPEDITPTARPLPPSPTPTPSPAQDVVCTPAALPGAAERAISGQLTVVNNTFNKILSVAVVYCGDDSIPANEQTCNETPLSAARVGSNALWPLYSSVNNSYYHYFLVEDAQAEPMEVGNNYLLAWVKAVTEDGEFISDYFVAVDFEGFKNIVDTLGGLDVDVPVTFDDYFYPVKGLENETCGFSGEQIAEFHAKYSGFELEKQFTCRYELIHFDQGKNSLDGEAALKYVRSRHSDQHGGDFARSQRQQALLIGLRDKFISLDAVRNAYKLFSEVSGMIRTDLDLPIIKKLLELDGEMEDYKITFVSLNDQNTLVSGRSGDGQFILLPKEGQGEYGEVQRYIRVELAK